MFKIKDHATGRYRDELAHNKRTDTNNIIIHH